MSAFVSCRLTLRVLPAAGVMLTAPPKSFARFSVTSLLAARVLIVVVPPTATVAPAA